MNLIILGPQGSGKGTQAKLIAEKFGLTHISTGALIRQEIESGSQFGKILEEKINTGELVSDAELFSILEKAPLGDGNGFILDGTPRNINQAKELENVFAKIGVTLDLVIHLDIPYEVSIERMTKRANIEHREDDNLEAMKKRLDIYQKETSPVIEYYRDQGKLIEIDGTPDVDSIFQTISRKLEDVK